MNLYAFLFKTVINRNNTFIEKVITIKSKLINS